MSELKRNLVMERVVLVKMRGNVFLVGLVKFKLESGMHNEEFEIK